MSKRLTPEECVRSKQIIPYGRIVSMLESHGFEIVKPSGGSTHGHFLHTNPQYRWITGGIQNPAKTNARAIAAAQAVLLLKRVQEKDARSKIKTNNAEKTAPLPTAEEIENNLPAGIELIPLKDGGFGLRYKRAKPVGLSIPRDSTLDDINEIGETLLILGQEFDELIGKEAYGDNDLSYRKQSDGSIKFESHAYETIRFTLQPFNGEEDTYAPFEAVYDALAKSDEYDAVVEKGIELFKTCSAVRETSETEDHKHNLTRLDVVFDKLVSLESRRTFIHKTPNDKTTPSAILRALYAMVEDVLNDLVDATSYARLFATRLKKTKLTGGRLSLEISHKIYDDLKERIQVPGIETLESIHTYVGPLASITKIQEKKQIDQINALSPEELEAEFDKVKAIIDTLPDIREQISYYLQRMLEFEKKGNEAAGQCKPLIDELGVSINTFPANPPLGRRAKINFSTKDGLSVGIPCVPIIDINGQENRKTKIVKAEDMRLVLDTLKEHKAKLTGETAHALFVTTPPATNVSSLSPRVGEGPVTEQDMWRSLRQKNYGSPIKFKK